MPRKSPSDMIAAYQESECMAVSRPTVDEVIESWENHVGTGDSRFERLFFRRLIRAIDHPVHTVEAWQKLKECVRDGQPWAIRFYLEYKLGKPDQVIEVKEESGDRAREHWDKLLDDPDVRRVIEQKQLAEFRVVGSEEIKREPRNGTGG